VSLFDAARYSAWVMRQFGPSRASPRRVAAARESRLRRLLRHAATRSAFYREKFKGLDLARCPLADLPVTTKGELMADLDRVVTDPDVRRADLERFIDDPANVGKLFLGRYPVCHTSGSQGQSLIVLQDRLTLDLFFAFQMTRGNLGYRRYGHLEAVRRLFAPGRLAVVISRPGFFPSAWVWQHLPPSLRHFVRLLYVPSSDPELADKLNTFRPTVLAGNPSVLGLLARRADEFRLRPALRQVVTSSETLTAAARGRIAEAFGAPVLNTYACGECMFLSSGCPTDPGAHVNADWAILEVVDADNRPVPPGQPGEKVLLTNLANGVQPFIRYEVGDRVTMAAAPCGCGSRLPRVERVDGRSADFFWVKAGPGYRPLLAYPFQHAFEFLREVREWQAVQRDRNRFLVRLELLPGAAPDFARARQKLDERLETVGLRGELEVELEAAARLDWDPRTGKFRRLVSEVGPPADLPPGQVPGVRASGGG
jgi:phenylacetate-coenzyme A ligase PaaK-like adenylate-forming protein